MNLCLQLLVLAVSTLFMALALYVLMRRFDRKLPKDIAVIIAIFGAPLVIVGGAKTNSPPARLIQNAIASLCTRTFNAAERQTGYTISEVRTNEIHDLTMPAGARLAENIARRGAHQDGFWLFDALTNRLAREGLDLENPVWVHTDGTVTIRSPAHGIPIEELSLYTTYSNITAYAPLQGSYGFLPGSKWPEFNISRIWFADTDRGSRVITWEGALRDRDPAQPVSFQAEFKRNGDIEYHYYPAQTNFTGIGVFRNGASQTFDLQGLQDLPDFPDLSTLQPFNLSTLVLSYIGDLGDGTGDTDDDGLTNWEEIKVHHTDPHLADTDGDGLSDGFEVANGTNPLNPDTDGNGVPDGWTQAQYDNHRLFNGEEGDRTVTVTLLEPPPAGNRAVLRIGDMPLLLCETNSWTFSIPTGTVWNVELRTDGLPVHLALEAGAGIFAENANEVFASYLLVEEQQEPLRSAPPEPQPPSGGSRGGSARICAPCILLEPAMQAVHDGETALVSVNCCPQTAALYGKLNWSFDPDYMTGRIAVAENRMSAIVSNLDGDWYPSITLHASRGDSLSSSAIVYFCGGMPTNNMVYSPGHTNVTITPVFRSCGHPFHDNLDDPKIFMEIEVGRDSASGWQHLAWVDTDPSTPGVQRRTAISRDNPPSLDWDMKADTAQPLSNGTDSLVYDSLTTFTRALPAVAAGQYVPPPFAKIITRTFDDKDNLIGEFASMLPIPQYVQITWDSTVLEEFRQPIAFDLPGEAGDIPPPTNVTIFAGCSAQEAATAFAGIASKVQALFPPDANIVVVGPDANVPQPHKTIVIQTGQYVDPVFGPDDRILGIAPNEHCHQRNDSPLGTAYVFSGAIRDSLSEKYGEFYVNGEENLNFKNDWRNVPLPLSTSLLTDYMAQVALHECGHSMGLVPTASAENGSHNNCLCGGHFMDDGSLRWPPVYLGFVNSLIQYWRPMNRSYLLFVFPSTLQGGDF